MCQMAGLLANNEVKRVWKQMATTILVLGSVYALQSECDLAYIYNMVTSHLYSLCLHDILVVILCTTAYSSIGRVKPIIFVHVLTCTFMQGTSNTM
jgi:hypothetical protein